MNRLLSILRGGGSSAPAGGCVSNGAVITGLYACAENNGCTASGDSSHAEGDGCTASGNFSHAQNWNTKAIGAASSASGFDCWAQSDLSMATGNQSATVAQSDFAHASGQFAERGDNQYRFHELKGETPGVVPGESVRLRIGNTENSIGASRVYAVTCTAIAVLMGTGSGAPQFAQYVRRFVLAATSDNGFPVISVVREEADIVVGATFAGASLTPEPTDYTGEWALTFRLPEGVTANVRAVAHVEFVELLGS